MKRSSQRAWTTAAFTAAVLGGTVLPAAADSATPGAGHGDHGSHSGLIPFPATAPSTATPAPTAADHGDMPGMNHDDMPGMDHGDMPGMNHDDMPGMDHGDMPGMNHSETPGTNPSEMPGMDHGESGGHGAAGHERTSGGHGATAQEPTNRQPVLLSFVGVNGAALAAGWVLRRRGAAQRDRRRDARRTAAAGD